MHSSNQSLPSTNGALSSSPQAKTRTSFWTFLIGLLFSRIGDSLYTFAVPWISYELTGSAWVMGSLYAVTVLPVVLFGPVVGVIVDRWDRRHVMMITDVGSAFLVSLIPLLHMFGALHVWHLYAVSFTLTALTMLFEVSTVAGIPHLVAKDDLTKANSRYQIVLQMSALLGPVLAGFAIAKLGGYHTLWLNVVSFGATFLAVSKLPSLGRPARHVIQYTEGFRHLLRDKLNLAISLQAMVGNFGYSAAAAVLMYDLLDVMKLTEHQVSLNYALLGVGGILGGLFVVPLARKIKRNVLIPTLLSIGACGFAFAAGSQFWLAPGIAFALVSACNTGWNVIVASVRQETLPPEMIGRVLGTARVFNRLAMPLGAMLGGMLSDAISPSSVFIVAMCAKAAEVLIALLSPMRRL